MTGSQLRVICANMFLATAMIRLETSWWNPMFFAAVYLAVEIGVQFRRDMNERGGGK